MLFKTWGALGGPQTRRTNTQSAIPGAPPADPTAAQQQTADQQQTAAITTASSIYELTDPHHPDYGKPLIGEIRDEIECTIVVNYLFYRADNITPQ